jgi:hypothetical protein
MAWFKYDADLKKSNSTEYDTIHNPGAAAPHSGIYRCLGCNKEVASNQTQPLPTQNKHQHTTQQGAIRWRLVVYADHNPQ